MTRMYDEELRPLGIQATQLTLLNAVALGEGRGAQMSRLTEVLAMDSTTLSRNLRPLEREGLIRIERSERDRRVRIACLTEAGREQLARALPLWRRAQERIVEALGGDAALELRLAFDHAVAAAVAAPAATDSLSSVTPPGPVRAPSRES